MVSVLSSQSSQAPGALVFFHGPNDERLLRAVQNFTLIAVSIGVVALYSSLRRPIWYDEWLHFLWGAFPASPETWGLIWQATSIDSSDTAVCCVDCCSIATLPTYMLLNNLGLNILGANEIALRFPSLVSACFLLLATIFFFRSKGFGFLWQLAALMIFFIHQPLMYYSGEARSYMPLAAAVAGTAVYFTATPAQRGFTSVRFIGWTAIVVGSLFHPYVAIYVFALAITFGGINLIGAPSGHRFRTFGKNLNIPMLLTAGALWLFFYLFGWGPAPKQGRDPYMYVASDLIGPVTLNFLFQPIFVWPLLFAALVGLLFFSLGATALNSWSRRRGEKEPHILLSILAPIALVIVSMVTGLALALAAIRSETPFISRYLVGSAVLALLGVSWFSAVLVNLTASKSAPFEQVSWLAPSVLLIAMALPAVEVTLGQINQLRVYEAEKNQLGLTLKERAASTVREAFNSASNRQEAANFNIYIGGPVYAEFRSSMIKHGLPKLRGDEIPDSR